MFLPFCRVIFTRGLPQPVYNFSPDLESVLLDGRDGHFPGNVFLLLLFGVQRGRIESVLGRSGMDASAGLKGSKAEGSEWLLTCPASVCCVRGEALLSAWSIKMNRIHTILLSNNRSCVRRVNNDSSGSMYLLVVLERQGVQESKVCGCVPNANDLLIKPCKAWYWYVHIVPYH